MADEEDAAQTDDAVAFKNMVDATDSEGRLEILTNFYNRWVRDTIDDTSCYGAVDIAIRNMSLKVDTLQMGLFSEARAKMQFELTYLRLALTKDLQDEPEDIKRMHSRFTGIYTSLTDAENAIRSMLCLKNSMVKKYTGNEEDDEEDESSGNHMLDLFRFTPLDLSKNSSYQNLLVYSLEKLTRDGLRRYGSDCYERVFTKEGYDTHSWRMKMDLKQYIYSNCNLYTNFQMWKNLTSQKGNVSSTVEYLASCLEEQFEDIERDRHVFAFPEGIYMAKVIDKRSARSKQGDGPVVIGSTRNENDFVSAWFPYEGAGKKIPDEVVACKYFDVPFPTEALEYVDWYDIIVKHAPSFKGIMDYQDWPIDVQKWLCIMIGRNIYAMDEELDDWQIIGYLLGQAGTGKSTILNHILEKIYEKTDIGVLSNNIEKKFGLSAIYNKFMFIGPEIKQNWSLEQSEFQSMVSGENISVAEKNKTAKSIKWNAPGMLAGNELPGYSDNAGSMARRILVFKFDKKVKNGDTTLSRKLKDEIPAIILACNRAYLDKIRNAGTTDIWNLVPEYFRKTRDEIAESTNALYGFLKSDYVTIGADKYVPEKEFLEVFKRYCESKNLAKKTWDNEYYGGPFQMMGIKREKMGRLRYPNVEGSSIKQTTFLRGVDIREVQ